MFSPAHDLHAGKACVSSTTPNRTRHLAPSLVFTLVAIPLSTKHLQAPSTLTASQPTSPTKQRAPSSQNRQPHKRPKHPLLGQTPDFAMLFSRKPSVTGRGKLVEVFTPSCRTIVPLFNIFIETPRKKLWEKEGLQRYRGRAGLH